MKELRDIKQEFDADKNTPLTFEQLTPGRRKPVIWTCAKRGHSWPATVSNRLKGTECPYCKGKLPILGETDFASKFPNLAAEWDYSRNKSQPEEFLPFSNARVAWVCGAGHHWEEKINNRTKNNLDCPYCANTHPIPGVNDLGTLFPWLKEQWDYMNNGNLLPEDIFPKSNKRVSWICTNGHRWETKIYHRTDGQNCPYCAGLKPIVGETDLATLEPDIAKQWHPEKNNGHLPSEYTRSSHYEAWWQCELGHEYRMPIYRRSRGCGCSICDGKTIVAGVNDLATLAPHLAPEWDYSRNKDIRPDQVALHSNTKFSWVCSLCGHTWKASPNNRVAGRGCPKCAGFCVDPEINSIAAVDPLLAEQWDFDRNAPLTPRNVAAYDNRDYFWTCSNGHSWQASPANRRKGTACPYCKGKLPVVGINDFGTICPAVAAQWHPSENGDSLPQHFLPNSHEEVWWMCENGHEWKQLIYERANGSTCPFCNHRKAIPGKNDLATLFPDLAQEWDTASNGGLLPSQILPNSGMEVWWKCQVGHRWKKSVHRRVQGNRCPYCTLKIPVSGQTDLATTHPELSKRWHPSRNKNRPTDYFPNHTAQVWWLCEEGHSFRASIREMVHRWRCPRCARKYGPP